MSKAMDEQAPEPGGNVLPEQWVEGDGRSRDLRHRHTDQQTKYTMPSINSDHKKLTEQARLLPVNVVDQIEVDPHILLQKRRHHERRQSSSSSDQSM